MGRGLEGLWRCRALRPQGSVFARCTRRALPTLTSPVINHSSARALCPETARLLGRGRRQLLALAALACVLGGGTVLQNRVWANHVALWTRAMRYSPDLWVRYNLGKGYLEQRQYAEARREFVGALELKPGPELFNELALALAGLGDKAGAIRSLRVALTLDPRLVEAKTNMGVLLHHGGSYREASEQFAEVLRLDPRVIEARFNLARACAALGDHGAAVREYEQFIARRPDDAEARARLAESYAALGREREAAEQVRIARTIRR